LWYSNITETVLWSHSFGTLVALTNEWKLQETKKLKQEVLKMTLVRWRPMRDLWNIQEEMNRAFGSFFGRTDREELTDGYWAPAVDIAENKDNLMVNVEVPGMKKEDVKVTFQDGILTIKGERKQEKEEKDKSFHRVERSYGSFCRSFTLPNVVQGDKIKANYKDGVLSIALPKVEEAKPKEISIDVA